MPSCFLLKRKGDRNQKRNFRGLLGQAIPGPFSVLMAIANFTGQTCQVTSERCLGPTTHLCEIPSGRCGRASPWQKAAAPSLLMASPSVPKGSSPLTERDLLTEAWVLKAPFVTGANIIWRTFTLCSRSAVVKLTTRGSVKKIQKQDGRSARQRLELGRQKEERRPAATSDL